MSTAAAAPLLSYQANTFSMAPLRTRTLLAICSLGMTLLACLGCALVGVMQLSLLQRAADGARITMPEAQANDLRYRVAHVILLVMVVLAAISLLMWMHRANKNLRAMTQTKLQFTPGAAVGWWFCPIMNLVMPYRAMREIYAVSTGKLAGGSAMVVGFWWLLWIVTNVISRVGTAMYTTTDVHPAVKDLIDRTWANMWNIPFYFAAGLLLMWIIWAVDAGQWRQRNISAGATGGGMA